MIDPPTEDAIRQWLEDWWRTATFTIATMVLIAFSRRLWRVTQEAFGLGHPAPSGARPSSRRGELARVFPARALRKGVKVASGTRIVVLDAGVPQLVLEAETYPRRSMKQRFRQRAISRAARALQYAVAPAEFDLELGSLRARGDVEFSAAMRISVRFDDKAPEKVLTWHLSRDGIVGEAEVTDTVRGAVEPWLVHRLAPLAPDEVEASAPAFMPELEQHINNCLLTEHGLQGKVKSLSFARVEVPKVGDPVEEAGAKLQDAIRKLVAKELEAEAGELKRDAEAVSGPKEQV